MRLPPAVRLVALAFFVVASAPAHGRAQDFGGCIDWGPSCSACLIEDCSACDSGGCTIYVCSWSPSVAVECAPW